MADGADQSVAATSARQILAWVLLMLIGSELLFLYSGISAADTLSKILVVGLPIVAWRALRWREAYLLTLCFILFGIAWLADRPVLEFSSEGLMRSAYLSSFVLLMALLREGALTSQSVLEFGRFLTQQPASRRFLALFAGSHFFAALINLGSLSLLAPIIQRGVRASLPVGTPLDDISRVRERRQLAATLRGFCWFLVWAPTAVTQAVMPTLMSGIDALKLMTAGFGLAILMLGVSWLEDAVRWRGFRRQLAAEGRLPQASAARIPSRAARRLGTVCLALIGLTMFFTTVFEVSIVTGVMLTAPVVVAAWVYLQRSTDGQNNPAVRLREIAFDSIPGYCREAVFIACAGFIGTLAAKLVPAGDVAAAINLANLPAWLVLWTLAASVWVFGQVGLSPITMAVFLGSLVAELPNMPVDMTLAALAIATGTAVCTAGAPFASGAIMLARATGHSSFTLTWRWNGAYTLIVLAVLPGVFAVLDAIW